MTNDRARAVTPAELPPCGTCHYACDCRERSLADRIAELEAALDRLAQRANRVTVGPRHQGKMTMELTALYVAQVSAETLLGMYDEESP